MAKHLASSLKQQTPMAGTFGNLSVATAVISLVAATVADTFHFLRLPAGSRLVDFTAFNSASSASTAMAFGYRGVDITSALLDTDYFGSGFSLAAPARHRANSVLPPLVLDEEFEIVGTLSGANIATSTKITASVLYEFAGSR